MKFLAHLLMPSLVIVSSACKTVQTSSSDVKFGAAEHQELGNAGYIKACISFKCPSTIDRKDKSESFSYGEIVSLSGDFYETWEKLDSDRARVAGAFIDKDYNDLDRFRAAVREELAAMNEQENDSTKTLPDQNQNYALAFGVEYVAMATNNVDHFGWHNMKRYVKEHGEAIKKALEGFSDKNPEKLRQALIINGFADHFLTDGFASGHIRIPRAQGLKWGASDFNYGLEASKMAAIGVLAKILHDNDQNAEFELQRDAKGKVLRDKEERPISKTVKGGLKVRNANESWFTRADGQLYIETSATDPVRRIPVEAVSLSVSEVLDAFYNGKSPKGVYAATELVPVIDPSEVKLVELFNPYSDFKKFKKDSGFMGYTLSEKNIRDFFTVLPELMEQFRTDVATDVDRNPELAKRLPSFYIEGYRKVQ